MRRSQRVEAPGRVTFVTGTDTGVGKTVLTGLLLLYLRNNGVHALAMKPFCTGDRHDAHLLAELQDQELAIDKINPVYFPEPLAPLAAAAKHKRIVRLGPVLRAIRALQHTCQWLLVEGIGGLLVPLTRHHTVADLISSLDCDTIVVSANRLGTLNHTLLTVEALRHRSVQRIKVVLMQAGKRDLSSFSNLLILRKLLYPTPVYAIGYLGPIADEPARLRKYFQNVQKIVARIFQ